MKNSIDSHSGNIASQPGEHSAGSSANLRALSDDAFAETLRARLVEQEDQLDYVTRSRLAAARARAVAQVREPGVGLSLNPFFNWRWAVPGVAVGALALALVLKAPLPGVGGGATQHPAGPAEVAELLGIDAEPGALAGDPDFYQWLSDMDESSS